jgi:hypothetical protein
MNACMYAYTCMRVDSLTFPSTACKNTPKQSTAGQGSSRLATPPPAAKRPRHASHACMHASVDRRATDAPTSTFLPVKPLFGQGQYLSPPDSHASASASTTPSQKSILGRGLVLLAEVVAAIAVNMSTAAGSCVHIIGKYRWCRQSNTNLKAVHFYPAWLVIYACR